jgi:hypothetical protein
MRKWLGILAIMVLAFAGVAAFVLWPPPITPGLTQENFDQVQVGMTRADVEAILGKPAVFAGTGFIGPQTHPDQGVDLWGDQQVVSIFFDGKGLMSEKHADQFRERAPDRLDKMRWRLKQQWRRWFP